MIRTLTRAKSFIYLFFAALLFATIFAIKADFFHYLITDKLWTVERAMLHVITLLILSRYPFPSLTKHHSSYIIQNTFGDSHKALGNYDKAETAYKKGSNMVPGLLLPKYLLAKLYIESGETEKAKTTAKEILNSPIKVKSSATNEIMREMRNIKTRNQKHKTLIPLAHTPL